MKRLALAALGVALLLTGSSRVPVSAQAPPVRGFDSLFDLQTGIVRDTNGDGLADAIAARVIVADAPSVEDMQVAANIAGRLGFETTAMTLPVVLRASDPAAANVPLPIYVGRTNPRILELVQRGVVDLKPLEKGQGLLAMAGTGVVIAGGDDAGTLAAGNVLAAYLPRLWGASGARLDHVQDELKKYLAARGVRAVSASVTAMVIDSDKRGLKSMRVTMPMTALDLPRAKAALPEALSASAAAAGEGPEEEDGDEDEEDEGGAEDEEEEEKEEEEEGAGGAEVDMLPASAAPPTGPRAQGHSS